MWISSFQNTTDDNSTVVRLGELNLVKKEDCSGSICLPQPQDFIISKNNVKIHDEYGPVVNDQVKSCNKYFLSFELSNGRVINLFP